MKKVGLILIAAVIVPSVVLAWLSLRAQRDQELVLERQQWLLYQGVVDALALEVNDRLHEHQDTFVQAVDAMKQNGLNAFNCATFDQQLRPEWPLADVGFAVSQMGVIGSPLPGAGDEAAIFLSENGGFLGNRESPQVYFNNNGVVRDDPYVAAESGQVAASQIARKTAPQNTMQMEGEMVPSKFTPAMAEFQQLVGDDRSGTIARFVNNEPNVLFWYRPESEPGQIYGAQIDLRELTRDIGKFIRVPAEHAGTLALALLNDQTKPVALEPAGFTANWSRPFVAAEISEALPHWEVAAYLVDPGHLARTATVTRLSLVALVGLLLLAISLGGWLVLADVRRQLLVARQKTDFVSSVSHELKTPLTSIRMFSELLSEKETLPEDKRRSYVTIINNECGRLTRLINNVLDFARLDREENRLDLSPLNVTEVVEEVWSMQQPQLAESGFATGLNVPSESAWMIGNHDAIAQILLNLISNAEKFSGSQKEIQLELIADSFRSGRGEIRVLDRGPGVPERERERIFEQFHRADDSLAGGTGGVGLGLAIARKLARAMGGDLTMHPRDSGGSVFVFAFDLADTTTTSTQS